MKKRSRSTVLLTAALLLILTAARADDSEPVSLGFDKPGWELLGDGSKVEELDGQQALRLITGAATYREIEFLDGTIEFDLRLTPHRSFAYLYFRMQSEAEHEEIYFRSHKTGLPDAIQYAPVYKGRSQWQLYHDDGSTAAALLPPDEWIPVKLVVQGTQAAVFVGFTDKPQLHIRDLAHGTKPGFLAFRSFKPVGIPDGTYVAGFANLVVRPGVVDYEFPQPEISAPAAGQVSEWELSRAFAPAEGDILDLPAEIMAHSEWQTAATNSQGLLEIERHLIRPEGARRAAVLARLQIPAKEAMIQRLDLGFSDQVSVFLNGRLLVVDNDSYSFNLPRRQGLLTADQLSVFLPLEKGDNELVLAVTDSFGGWGLSGRLGD